MVSGRLPAVALSKDTERKQILLYRRTRTKEVSKPYSGIKTAVTGRVSTLALLLKFMHLQD